MYPKRKFNPRYLKLIFLFLVTISALNLKSQDTLLRPKLRLFDIQIGLGLAQQSPPKITKSNISEYTSHKEYTSEAFMAGYSDTIGRPFFYANRHYIGDLVLGFNLLFQTHNTKSKFLKRLKPRLSINYSKSTLFRYLLGYEKLYQIDTLYYANPSYPPLIEKYYETGYMQYSYSSSNLCLGLGSHFDIVQHRKIIVYAGFLYGLSAGDARFRVQKLDSNSEVDVEFRENISFTSRFIFPMGLLLRAKPLSKKNINAFVEMKPGFYLLNIKNGAKAQGNFFSVNAGVRFSLQPHK